MKKKIKRISLAYSTIVDYLLSEKELVDFKYDGLYEN